jgi:hypothetical protein
MTILRPTTETMKRMRNDSNASVHIYTDLQSMIEQRPIKGDLAHIPIHSFHVIKRDEGI